MKCPACDSSNAYIGFNSIECSMPKCMHYAKRQREARNSKKSWPDILDRIKARAWEVEDSDITFYNNNPCVEIIK